MAPDHGKLDRIEDILEDLRAGRMVIMMDDEDRENEGDLIMAASKVRPEDVNFMAREARVHRFGKRRSMDRCVNGRHEGQVQLVAALFGEGKADEAAAVFGHEVDGVGGDFFGGHGEVAFVFAVLVVNENDHAALANFFDGFFDGGEMGTSVRQDCSLSF